MNNLQELRKIIFEECQYGCEDNGDDISLAEVLIALDADNYLPPTAFGIIGTMIIHYLEDFDMDIICNWDLTKVLDNQSEITILSLLKLLKGDKNDHD